MLIRLSLLFLDTNGNPFRFVFVPVFNQVRYQPRPAGLVTGAQAHPIIAIEVLIEQVQALEIRVIL